MNWLYVISPCCLIKNLLAACCFSYQSFVLIRSGRIQLDLSNSCGWLLSVANAAGKISAASFSMLVDNFNERPTLEVKCSIAATLLKHSYFCLNLLYYLAILSYKLKRQTESRIFCGC